MTRQRAAQLRNMAAGRCQHHKGRPLAPSSRTRCVECVQRDRDAIGYPGQHRPLPAEWDAVDWSDPDHLIASALWVTVTAVQWQRKRRTQKSVS